MNAEPNHVQICGIINGGVILTLYSYEYERQSTTIPNTQNTTSLSDFYFTMKPFKQWYILCALVTISVGFCLPVPRIDHVQPCRDLDGIESAESGEKPRLQTSDGKFSGARAMALRTVDRLIKRSDKDASQAPPDNQSTKRKFSTPTREEAASVLSTREMSRFNRLQRLSAACQAARDQIKRISKQGMQPDRELIERVERLKPHESAYRKLQKAVIRKLINQGKAPPEMVEQDRIRKQRGNERATTRYRSKTRAERVEVIATQSNRRRANRETQRQLEARLKTGNLTRKQLKRLDELRAQNQRKIDRENARAAKIRARWEVLDAILKNGDPTTAEIDEWKKLNSKRQARQLQRTRMTEAEREAYVAGERSRVKEYYEALRIRLEKLRAKVEDRTAKTSLKELQEFTELEGRLRRKSRGEKLQSSKKKESAKRKQGKEGPGAKPLSGDGPNPSKDPTSTEDGPKGADPSNEDPPKGAGPSNGHPLESSGNAFVSKARFTWSNFRKQWQAMPWDQEWLQNARPIQGILPLFGISPTQGASSAM